MGGKTFKYDWTLIQKDYDSGLSYRDLISKYHMSTATLTSARKRGDLVIRDKKDAMSLYNSRVKRVHSPATREKLSRIRVESLNAKAFYSKRHVYNGITLDSSYELEVAKSLDDHGVKWIRPLSLEWNDNGVMRRYIPDFYLPEYDVYLDPKNDYLIPKDTRKISSAAKYNNVKIYILNKDNLNWNAIQNIICGRET